MLRLTPVHERVSVMMLENKLSLDAEPALVQPVRARSHAPWRVAQLAARSAQARV
jgi:hypothetical protein